MPGEPHVTRKAKKGVYKSTQNMAGGAFVSGDIIRITLNDGTGRVEVSLEGLVLAENDVNKVLEQTLQSALNKQWPDVFVVDTKRGRLLITTKDKRTFHVRLWDTEERVDRIETVRFSRTIKRSDVE
jgi:hypothetical protein